MTTKTSPQIKCGKCSKWQAPVYHSTVEDVRACYQNTGSSEGLDRLRRAHDTNPRFTARNGDEAREAARTRAARTVPSYVENPATDGQIGFLNALMEKRDWAGRVSPEVVQTCQMRMGNKPLSFDQASQAITALKPLANKDQGPVSQDVASKEREALRRLLDKVPNGRYATDVDGKIHFYVVKNVKTGTGHTVRVVREQASDTLHKMYRNQQIVALGRIIVEGLEKAGLLYSEKLGQCRNCGRLLTDTDNPYKVYGYGPDCGPRKMG